MPTAQEDHDDHTYERDLRRAGRRADQMRRGHDYEPVLWLCYQMLHAILNGIKKILKESGAHYVRTSAHQAQILVEFNKVHAHLDDIDPPEPEAKFSTVVTAVRTRRT